MPLGILEDHRMAHVPGTVLLEEALGIVGLPETGMMDHRALKHDKSGTIILVPQPSGDPNDPLNWPRWRKEMFMVAAVWGVGCVGGSSCSEFDQHVTKACQLSDRSLLQLTSSWPMNGVSR